MGAVRGALRGGGRQGRDSSRFFSKSQLIHVSGKVSCACIHNSDEFNIDLVEDLENDIDVQRTCTNGCPENC